MKIAVDAGHGFYTLGKRTPDDEREWTFNDKVVKAFIAEISKYEGVEVRRFDDVTGKTDVPLKTRTDGANRWGADLYISFHHNANTSRWGSWGGVETHVYKTAPSRSVQLAKLVQPELVKAYGLRDRGIKYTDLHITRETRCDAILIEGGFMDSTTDIHKLRDDSVLAAAGKGVARAVAQFYKLATKPIVEEKSVATVSGVVPDKFGMYPKVIMKVKTLVPTDIRKAPSHQAAYVRDAKVGEVFDVYGIENIGGTQWHCVGGTNWIDGNNGKNLYWLDNPALKRK